MSKSESRIRNIIDVFSSSASLIQSINSTIQTIAVVIIVVQVFSFGSLFLNKLDMIDDQLGSVVSRFKTTAEAINSDAALEAAGQAKQRSLEFVEGMGEIRDRAHDLVKGDK